MAFQETAQKAYARYGGDAEKTYKVRRFSISQRLPHMSGSQLRKRLSDLDEEIADLKRENAQLKAWIRQIKREGSISAYFDHMHRTLTEPQLGMLQLRLDVNKTALEWMHRERRIYAWALRLRRLESVKLPALRFRQWSLEKRLEGLKQEIKATEEKLASLRSEQGRAEAELAGVKREIRLLIV